MSKEKEEKLMNFIVFLIIENKELRSKIKHTEDLLNQALKELEVLQ